MSIKEGENSQRPSQERPSGVNETKFRSMFKLSPVGMAQVSAKTSKFVQVNEKFCEWTAYLAQELTPADITYIEDRAFNNESHQWFADQSRAMQHRWFDVFAFRLDGADSRKVAILFDDVGLQKGAEQKLIESEKRLRIAITAVSDVVWTNDSDGLMQGGQSGWGKFTGQSHEAYQGLGWSRAIHPDDVQQTIDDWKNEQSQASPAFSGIQHIAGNCMQQKSKNAWRKPVKIKFQAITGSS